MDIDKVRVYCEGIGHLNASVANRDEDIKKNVKYLNYLLSAELETVLNKDAFNTRSFDYEKEMLRARIAEQETPQIHAIWDESACGYVEPQLIPAKKYKGYSKK